MSSSPKHFGWILKVLLLRGGRERKEQKRGQEEGVKREEKEESIKGDQEGKGKGGSPNSHFRLCSEKV